MKASRHLVWVRYLTPARSEHSGDGDDQWPEWLMACYHLTPHLQRFGHDSALLDLGSCTDDEAVSVVRELITRLQRQQITLRAAIGPSGILAQLALFHRLPALPARAQERDLVALIPAERAADLLRQLPIGALTSLQFADRTTVTSDVVAKLEDYGVRTLAHLARLDDASLRRQFGTILGTLLAAVARGEDLLPFQPTPAPLRLCFRLRLTTPVAAERLLAGLPPFTLEVASRLARQGLHAHRLEVRLRWETGTAERIVRRLTQPISGGRALAETVERMLTLLVQTGVHAHAHAHQANNADALSAIEGLRLIASHLAPRYPAQHAFWPQRARRLAAARELADALSRRYGKPLVFQSALTAPDAIFDQDRLRLVPLDAGVASRVGEADVLEDQRQGVARPYADVAEAPGTSAEIPHGVHWW